MNTRRPKIAVLNAPGAGPWPGLDPLSAEADVIHGGDEASLAPALGDAEIVVVTDIRTKLLRALWPRAKALRWIHATSAGVDAIMFPELETSDVLVTNARGLFDCAIAESVVGMILAFAKDLRTTFELQGARRWRHRETESVRGQNLLVVGAGSIGRQIGRYGQGIGLAATGVARRARDGDPDLGRIHPADDLPALLPEADWVAVAAPLTRHTRGLFDREAFRRMKPGARLINVGRGPIVNTEDLCGALDHGEIAGAALDVFEEEPLPDTHPLWTRRDVILTAHMAGDFVGWRQALSDQFIRLYRQWSAGQTPSNIVDKPDVAT